MTNTDRFGQPILRTSTITRRPAGLEPQQIDLYDAPAGDPFKWACCNGTKPAHTSRCRNAY